MRGGNRKTGEIEKGDGGCIPGFQAPLGACLVMRSISSLAPFPRVNRFLMSWNWRGFPEAETGVEFSVKLNNHFARELSAGSKSAEG
jgi:hypothetical protein